jgi:hypothetical protein
VRTAYRTSAAADPLLLLVLKRRQLFMCLTDDAERFVPVMSSRPASGFPLRILVSARIPAASRPPAMPA